MSDTLAGIALPAQLHWDDEFAWSPVGQAIDVALDGALVVEESAQQAGRPMTLRGGVDRAWAQRATVAQLYALAAQPAQQHTLVYRGETYTVIFDRRSGAPVEARALWEDAEPEDTDDYELTLRLLQV